MILPSGPAFWKKAKEIGVLEQLQSIWTRDLFQCFSMGALLYIYVMTMLPLLPKEGVWELVLYFIIVATPCLYIAGFWLSTMFGRVALHWWKGWMTVSIMAYDTIWLAVGGVAAGFVLK